MNSNTFCVDSEKIYSVVNLGKGIITFSVSFSLPVPSFTPCLTATQDS